jgi:hypothetical protein
MKRYGIKNHYSDRVIIGELKYLVCALKKPSFQSSICPSTNRCCAIGSQRNGSAVHYRNLAGHVLAPIYFNQSQFLTGRQFS